MRMACDTGGTFTDLIVQTGDGERRMFKAPTTPQDPLDGVFDAIGIAASAMEMTTSDLLRETSHFIHATTHPLNSVLTGNAARTALLVTHGHPDILLLREGGRRDPFDTREEFPQPFIPRGLTFELPGRITADGSELRPLDEAAVRATLVRLRALEVEAIAVCLLWSVVNGAHERRVGELIEEVVPGMPYTLSHVLNPTLREYRRASSTAIDAALKPLVAAYLGRLDARLRKAGFAGRALVVTSSGGMQDADQVAVKPILAINSGPAMAPVAAARIARADVAAACVIVADTGGTTFDVSVVRDGRIPVTRELWIGEPGAGHITGFPAVAVRSIGAGGGSLASVDAGGFLRVGPRSAGAQPGPACYGRGGTQPTVTDAALALGWLDPAYFLGGRMRLDEAAARQALEQHVARPLSLSVAEAAGAVMRVATESMAQAILEVTVHEGIDPAGAALVGGGGAAGLNIVAIARRIGCNTVLIPQVGAALSAGGALVSDLGADFRVATFQTSARFDAARARRDLDGLRQQCEQFLAGPGAGAARSSIEYFAEARYTDQVWEIEIPLPEGGEVRADDFVAAFHAEHERIFMVRDPQSAVEVIGWRAVVTCALGEEGGDGPPTDVRVEPSPEMRRQVRFQSGESLEVPIVRTMALAPGQWQAGPAVVESEFTTIVVDPGTRYARLASGSLVVVLEETS